jgi:hypothetical protein
MLPSCFYDDTVIIHGFAKKSSPFSMFITSELYRALDRSARVCYTSLMEAGMNNYDDHGALESEMATKYNALKANYDALRVVVIKTLKEVEAPYHGEGEFTIVSLKIFDELKKMVDFD